MFLNSTLLVLYGLVLSSMILFFTRKINPRNFLVIVFAMCSFLCILLVHMETDIILMSTIAVNTIFSGISVLFLRTITVQIFPTEICGMVTSLGMVSFKMGSFVGASIIRILLQLNCEMVFYGCAALMVIATICQWAMPKGILLKEYL